MAALLTRAIRGGALSVGLDLRARAAAAISTAGRTGTGVHGAAGDLSGGRGAAASLAGASRLAGVRSMSTANGHGAVEPRCSCEREILLLRKELLDESRKNQELYGELAEQNRIVREFVTIKAEDIMVKTNYSMLGCVAAFVFSLVTFGAPYAEEVWQHRAMEAMEKKYGLVAIPRGRVACRLPHSEGGSAAAPPPAAHASHASDGEDKKEGDK